MGNSTLNQFRVKLCMLMAGHNDFGRMLRTVDYKGGKLSNPDIRSLFISPAHPFLFLVLNLRVANGINDASQFAFLL